MEHQAVKLVRMEVLEGAGLKQSLLVQDMLEDQEIPPQHPLMVETVRLQPQDKETMVVMGVVIMDKLAAAAAAQMAQELLHLFHQEILLEQVAMELHQPFLVRQRLMLVEAVEGFLQLLAQEHKGLPLLGVLGVVVMGEHPLQRELLEQQIQAVVAVEATQETQAARVS